jgi:uncharacterized protein (TIGR01777 family)
MKKKIILAGGSGFLGHTLAGHFLSAGYSVTNLTRSPKPMVNGVRELQWDARTVGDWTSELEVATAVINLTGRSVNCRYSAENRVLILESRVHSTRVIGEAIARCKTPPLVWLNASTATIYQHTFGPAWDEAGNICGTREAKDGFSVQVATEWEQALSKAPTPATRKVAMRTAMVLGNDKNSVFPMLCRLARFGLGGNMGDGRQFVSWIHQADFCRAVEWLITRQELRGAVNLCAPNPLSNADMMKAFREVVGMPVGLPAARWMLEVGAFALRTETELILKSRRVSPRRLVNSGFKFHFPFLREALKDLRINRRIE